MGYTVKQVEDIASKLRELPPIEPPPKDLSKSDVVKMLAKEIKSLQKRGYSLEQIATSLKGEGVDISTPTLKSYLQKSKPKSTRKETSNILPASTGISEVESPVTKVEVTGNNKKASSKGGSVPRPDSVDL